MVGAAEAWVTTPEWMDFLRPDSPAHRHKLLERELYLRLWAPHVRPGCRVLDIGGGIGRFSMWCLDLGCDVHLVDADAISLEVARGHAQGRPGTLTTYHTTAEELPPVQADVVIAAELLCYVHDAGAVLAGLRPRLVPGGALLFSVEARWGWGMALDAPAGHLGALLEDGVLHIPGDRYVRTFDEVDVRALFQGWALPTLERSHYVLSGPLQQLAGDVDADALFAWEDRLRGHSVLGQLNRAWIGVAHAGPPTESQTGRAAGERGS